MTKVGIDTSVKSLFRDTLYCKFIPYNNYGSEELETAVGVIIWNGLSYIIIAQAVNDVIILGRLTSINSPNIVSRNDERPIVQAFKDRGDILAKFYAIFDNKLILTYIVKGRLGKSEAYYIAQYNNLAGDKINYVYIGDSIGNIVIILKKKSQQDNNTAEEIIHEIRNSS